MIRPKMSHEYAWKIIVTGILVDCSDSEEEACRMYKDYKVVCGDNRISLSHNGFIVRESVPAIKS